MGNTYAPGFLEILVGFKHSQSLESHRLFIVGAAKDVCETAPSNRVSIAAYDPMEKKGWR